MSMRELPDGGADPLEAERDRPFRAVEALGDLRMGVALELQPEDLPVPLILKDVEDRPDFLAKAEDLVRGPLAAGDVGDGLLRPPLPSEAGAGAVRPLVGRSPSRGLRHGHWAPGSVRLNGAHRLPGAIRATAGLLVAL